MGHDVPGDIHMGDWGLQMGLIISQLKEEQPDLPYFDENYTARLVDDKYGKVEIIYMDKVLKYQFHFLKPDYCRYKLNHPI